VDAEDVVIRYLGQFARVFLVTSLILASSSPSAATNAMIRVSLRLNSGSALVSRQCALGERVSRSTFNKEDESHGTIDLTPNSLEKVFLSENLSGSPLPIKNFALSSISLNSCCVLRI
jgi:hypothetical protein